MTIAVPGNDPYAITVGALDGNETAGCLGDDTLAEYSAGCFSHTLLICQFIRFVL